MKSELQKYFDIELEFASDGRLRKNVAAELKKAGWKFCPVCQLIKPVADFPRNHTYCTLCKRDRERGRDQSKGKQRRRQLKVAAMELIGGPHCTLCNFSEVIEALEFHHKDRESKERQIANALNRGATLEQISSEIKKCIVLCANCHRGVHAGIYHV